MWMLCDNKKDKKYLFMFIYVYLKELWRVVVVVVNKKAQKVFLFLAPFFKKTETLRTQASLSFFYIL